MIVQYVDYLNMNRNDRNKTKSLKMLDGVWSGTVQVGTGTGTGTGYRYRLRYGCGYWSNCVVVNGELDF